MVVCAAVVNGGQAHSSALPKCCDIPLLLSLLLPSPDPAQVFDN